MLIMYLLDQSIEFLEPMGKLSLPDILLLLFIVYDHDIITKY